MLLSGGIDQDGRNRISAILFCNRDGSVVNEDFALVGYDSGVIFLFAGRGLDRERIVVFLAGSVNFIGSGRNLVHGVELEHIAIQLAFLVEGEGNLVTVSGGQIDDVLLVQVDAPGLVVVNGLAVANVNGVADDGRRPGSVLEYDILLGIAGSGKGEGSFTRGERGIGIHMNRHHFLGRCGLGGNDFDPGAGSIGRYRVLQIGSNRDLNVLGFRRNFDDNTGFQDGFRSLDNGEIGFHQTHGHGNLSAPLLPGGVLCDSERQINGARFSGSLGGNDPRGIAGGRPGLVSLERDDRRGGIFSNIDGGTDDVQGIFGFLLRFAGDCSKPDQGCDCQ